MMMFWIGRTSASVLKHDLVVQTETQFRHAREVALHLDSTEDLAADDVAVGIDEQIDGLDDIKEDFVFAIPDAFGAPADGIGDGHRGAHLLELKLVGFLGDVLLKDLGLGGLDVTKVDHLVEKLVDDDKIVADGLFFELLEVFGKDLQACQPPRYKVDRERERE